MAKSRDAFRTISEVSEWLETPAHVLRFWESRFTQIKPVKRAGGRRYYRPTDMTLLGGIKRLLHDDGITIKGVQKILREKGVKYVSSLSIDEVGGDSSAASQPAEPEKIAETPIEEILSEDQPLSDILSMSDAIDLHRAEHVIDPSNGEAVSPVLEALEPVFEAGDVAADEPSIFADLEDEYDTQEGGETGNDIEDFSIVAHQNADAAQTDRMTALYQRLMALRDRLQGDVASG